MKTKRTVFEVNDVYRVMENSELIYTLTNSEKLKREEYKKLFKFYSKIILWQRYAAWLRAYRPCIHSQWSVS